MKKILTLSCILAAVLIMANCTPKVAGTVADKEPAPTKSQVMASFTKDQLEQGHTLYTNNCGKCHGLKDPDSRTPVEWNNILKKMIPKAKLNYDDGKLVRAYLVANSKAE